MASRRMFSKDVVCSDRFLDMPASAQIIMWGEKCLILLRQLLKKYRSIALNVEMLLMLNHLLTFTHLRDGMLGKQK